MDAAGLSNLIVASLDLQLVRLVRDAMARPAGSGEPASGLGPAPTIIERRFRIEPDPVILPRERIEPEPYVEPRQVIRPPDRFEPDERDLIPVPLECYKPARRSPIEPPWKVLPWEDTACCARAPRPKIKVVAPPPDVVHKGSLIDFFI